MRPFVSVSSGVLGVFAPSSPFPEDRFEAGVRVLEGLGFQVRVPEAARARTGYLAGDDAHRAAAFTALLEDPEVDGLIAARGGYGLHRILDRLDPERLARADKPVVGFSDLSALHAALNLDGQRVAIHGPVVTQLAGLPPEDATHLARLLRGEYPDGFVLTADGPAIASGRATGRLVGGCLSVVLGLLGTRWWPSTEGAILVLEDVGEAPYRVDRMLSQLRLAGAFDGIAGITLGDFVACHPPRPNEPTVEEVLAERLGDLGVPVLTGLPIGHGSRNRAVPLGGEATLDADAGTLSVGGQFFTQRNPISGS